MSASSDTGGLPATLPWEWYASEEAHRLERERIFARTWQYVGHAGQLPGPGTVAPARAGHVPLVLTHDADGALRAFVNVCRHRGSVLVEEPARRSTIQCPYHAWTYGLDGALRRAPRSEREPGFDPSALGLVPVALDRWGPFLFACPGEPPGPLADALGPLPGLVAGAGVDVDALTFHHRAESSYAADWKVICENYLECLHCAVAHPGFSAVMDVSPEAYELEETTPTLLTQRAPVRDAAARFDAAGEVPRGQFHFLWPSLTVNIAPGRPNLSLGPVLPDGPGRASRFLDYFVAPGADPAWVEEMLAWDDEVGAEDRALVERVQRGIGSGALPGGAMLPASERLVARFTALVRGAIG